MHNRIVYQALLLIVCASLVLSACQPAPGPQAVTPTPEIAREATEPVEAEPQPNRLAVIDDGAPLPPRVVDRQPSGGQELPPEGAIVLAFDQPMDAVQTAAALQVVDGEGRAVPGQAEWSDPRTLHYQPSRPLETGALYFASLETEATSAAGVALSEPYGFQFQTTADLQVSQVFPADGAQDVAADAVITVIFNRPVTPLVIAEERDDLPDPLVISPQTAGTGEWVNTSVYAFRPEKGLQAGVEYRVTVSAGLADAAGESTLAQDYTWTFSTSQPGIEWFALSDGRYNPQYNATNIALDEYISIRFLQPMGRSSTEAALSLTAVDGTPVALETEWRLEDMLLVITPTQRLALGTGYELILDTTAQAATGGALESSAGTQAALDWRFITVPEPAIVSTSPADGETQTDYTGNLNIQFASPMRLDTVKERIVVTPQPEEDIEWYYSDWDWSLSAYFLEPSTDYVVRFLPGMEDIYGNRIPTETVVRFTTAALQPYARLMLPWQAPMVRAGEAAAQTFYVASANADRVTLELYSLSLDDFIGLATYNMAIDTFTPESADLVWMDNAMVTRRLNERSIEEFSPRAQDGGPLKPGLYFLALSAPGVPRYGQFVDQRLLFVADANLTYKSSNSAGLVWVTDLVSGAPVAGQGVTIYDEKGQRIDTGTTDAQGLATVDLSDQAAYSTTFAITEGGAAFGFASSQWGSGMSPSDYGIWFDQYAPANRPTAYVYTERPIYRPGQPVYFKGIVRQDNDLDYSLPDVNRVQVKITNYQETVYDEAVALSEFGSFDVKFLLDNAAALGYYSVEVYLPGTEDTPIGQVAFNVAEYRKPEFQVGVTARPANLLSGEHFIAEVQADYYSGGGVAEAAVSWTLVTEPFIFQPPEEYAGYEFMDRAQDLWGMVEDTEAASQMIAEGTGITDASGRLEIDVPVDLSEYTTGRRLIFEASVTDVAQTTVSARAEVVGHHSKVYPGIRSQTYVGEAGEEQGFEIVLLNWDGRPLPNQPITVEIVERRWYSVQEQDASGRVEWKSAVEETPVVEFNDLTTDANGEAVVSFTPNKGGIYRARVRAVDDQGNPGAASAFMWVAGDDYVPWQQTNDRGFELVTDKKRYTPGETAQVLIASPFQGETYALVTVERGGVRASEVIQLHNNSTIYELPVTPDMAPNVYVSVSVVKGIDATNPRPSFKMGVAQFEVDTRQQTLNVEISADHEQAAPGETVNYTVRTTDADGQPVSAELSLSLSDLATLSLLPPNSAPILEHFYARRSLAVWTSMTLVNSLEDYNVQIEDEVQQGGGAGSGGGKGGGELGVIDVRQDFPDTALWEGHLITGQNGEATVSVTLPDNLTTWRMDARAVTVDTRVGQVTSDLISTRPLLVRPQTPRFFIDNDRATLGAAVHNNTAETLTVAVSLEAHGLELNGEAEQSITVAAGGQVFVTWEGQVPAGALRVDLIFRASANGSLSGELEDASRPPQGTLDNQGIPVYRYAAPETVGTSGQLMEGGTRVEGILLPRDVQAYDAEMTIQVAPSLAAGLTDGLEYLAHYPYECIEQTISRFLPNVVMTRALNAAGLTDDARLADLETQVETALQRLYNFQNSDGGWGWWQRGESHALTSAYVILGLTEAQKAGYTVSEAVVQRGINYLRRQSAPPAQSAEPYVVNRKAFILFVLAYAGEPQVSNTVKLYEARQRLDIYAQAYLAHALWEIDNADPRLDTLLADFNSQAIVSATGTHWEEDVADRWNWNTDTHTTAIVLLALSRIDPENPLNANAVRWLMSNRTAGHWQGTQETAWTLMALTNWMEASGELNADYDYAIALNGRELSSGTANRDTLRETQVIEVGLQDLLQDELNRLALARDEGPGNLYYTAHLEVALPVEAIEALDQGIVVSRSYYRLDDWETPVTEAGQGELLLVRLTVVAPHALHYVVVDDPLPAGLEAVDPALETSTQNIEPPQQDYSFDDLWRRGWGWWGFDNIQFHDEKVVLSADYLPAGTYVYTYLARAGTPGDFGVIPATAQEFYFPEVYGRSAGSRFVVRP